MAEENNKSESQSVAEEQSLPAAEATEEAKEKPSAEDKPAKAKKEKPPAVEDKPFAEFIEQHFIPDLKKALGEQGVKNLDLSFSKQSIPIATDNEQCWQVIGNWQNRQRQFEIYFLDENISGQKAFSCTATNGKPSTIESFMIDERKVTLDLLVLYTLQRLNGQKWLARN